MRPRKLSKLHYQFNHLNPKLNVMGIANALIESGMIKITKSSKSEFDTRYIETEAMRRLDPSEFESVIASILRAHRSDDSGGE